MRDQKFNEVSNERRDCESYLLSFIFFIIFFDRALMTWRESSSAMFNCWNKLYKFYCAHRSFFCNDWLIFRQSWLNFSVCRDAWTLCLRFSNVFFCFSWSSSSRSWHLHLFHFHSNKLFIKDLTCHCHELAMFLFCQF